MIIQYVYILTKSQELYEFSEDIDRKSFDLQSSFEPIYKSVFLQLYIIFIKQ